VENVKIHIKMKKYFICNNVMKKTTSTAILAPLNTWYNNLKMTELRPSNASTKSVRTHSMKET